MAWTTKKGVILHATSGFITVPGGCVELLQDPSSSLDLPVYTPGSHSNSPLTLDSDSFNMGWNITPPISGARDDSSGVSDVRLCGHHSVASQALRIQMGTAAGQYRMWFGLANIGNGNATTGTITVSDANGTWFTITVPTWTANQVVDAQGTKFTNAAAWDAASDGTGVGITSTTTDTSNGNGGPLVSVVASANIPISFVGMQYLGSASALLGMRPTPPFFL